MYVWMYSHGLRIAQPKRRACSKSVLSICKAASTVRGADAQTERIFPCRNLSLRYGSQTPRCESRLGSQEPILLQRRSSGSTSEHVSLC